MYNFKANHHQICNDDKLLEVWKQQIIKLAKYKNACIKLSGLSGGQPSAGLVASDKWRFEAEQEKIDFVIEHFDEDNIVYGSDWPVSCLPIKVNERKNFLRLWTLNLYNYLKKRHGKILCDKVFMANPMRIYNLNL